MGEEGKRKRGGFLKKKILSKSTCSVSPKGCARSWGGRKYSNLLAKGVIARMGKGKDPVSGLGGKGKNTTSSVHEILSIPHPTRDQCIKGRMTCRIRIADGFFWRSQNIKTNRRKNIRAGKSQFQRGENNSRECSGNDGQLKSLDNEQKNET